MSNLFKIIKNNFKFYVILAIVIAVGTAGTTFALIFSNFNAINVNTITSTIDANISYDDATNNAEIVNNGNMLPIADDKVDGPDVTDPRVLKVKFNVSGNDTNPKNTIYDIALYASEIDCDLRTEDLKWRLYKGTTLKSSGNLSPVFDTMDDGRLVLTNTQEDLTTSTDEYTFLLWISESCTGDITQCDPIKEQNKYLNKTLKANIKVELTTGTKKNLERITASANSCDYIETDVPVCNALTYNGTVQTLVNSGTNYTLANTTGTKAGKYAVTAKLKDGYKWSNGATADKVLTCNIDKKSVTVTTLDQTITYGNKISSTTSDVNISNLITGNTLSKVTLSPTIVDVGEGNINTNNIKILDEEGNDVTYNYSVKKNNTGVLTVLCANIAEEPAVTNLTYTGSVLTGVTGGSYVTISGIKNSSAIGEHTIKVTPNKNYCWSDRTTGEKEYTWSIIGYGVVVTLDNNGADTAGTTEIYARYMDKPYLDSAYVNAMTTSTNNITIPTKEGYTFGGYYTDAGGNGKLVIGSNGYATEELLKLTFKNDLTLYAKWDAGSSTPYKVQHWQQNIGAEDTQNSTNYTLKDTDNLTGMTGASVTPVVKTYAGFTGPSTKTVTIAADGSTVVNYYYTRNSYTVTLTKGTGISDVTGSGTYEYQESVTINATASAGYTWNNWTGTHSTTTKEYTFAMPASNVVDTANAILNTYTISYDGNGSTSGSTASSSHTYDTAKALTANGFKKTGYTFTGWNTKADGTGTSYTDGESVTNLTTINGETVTLYAQWRINKVTVKYHVNGGDITETTTSSGGTVYNWSTTDSLIYLNNELVTTSKNYGTTGELNLNNYNNDKYIYVTKANYHGMSDAEWKCMSGPCVHDTYDQDVYQDAAAICDASEADCTIVIGVNWTPNTYTVAYNGNGSTSGSTTSSTHTYGTAKALTANGFKKTGYTFTGWNTKADGTGTTYADKASVKNLTSTNGATVTLYAQWRINKIRINFNVNGGTITASTTSSGGTVYNWTTTNSLIYKNGTLLTSTYNYGTTGNVDMPNYNNSEYIKITKTNYQAVQDSEWMCMSENCTYELYDHAITGNYDAADICDASEADCTVVLGVNWTLKTYNVTYNANGGSGAPSTQKKTHGQTLKLSSKVPTRSGYFFMGWATSSTATTVNYLPGANYTANSAVTLYAVWKQTLIAYVTNRYTTGSPTYKTNSTSSKSYYFTNNGMMNDRLDASGNFIAVDSTNTNTGNIRYYGSNPNNYIQIGDSTSLWRILGLFKDVPLPDGTTKDLIKITRATPLADAMPLHSSKVNNWPSYTLMTYFNSGDYYTGLPTTVKNRIQQVTWKLGGSAGTGVYADVMYKRERGTSRYSTARALEWDGNIALMYPSDYSYASNLSSCGETVIDYEQDVTNCVDTNYLHTGSNEWTITHYTANAQTGVFIHSDGHIGNNYYVTNEYLVRPTMYLDPEILYTSGTGTSTSPILIEEFNNYIISYNLNGGTNPSSAVTSYTLSTPTFNLPTPTRAGYTFGGWYTNSSFTGSKVTSIAQGSSGNKTFYAKWTAKTETINAKKYSCEGTNRLAVLGITTCTGDTCIYNTKNGVSNTFDFSTDTSGTPTWTVNRANFVDNAATNPDTGNQITSITTNGNTCSKVKRYISATGGLKCRTSVDTSADNVKKTLGYCGWVWVYRTTWVNSSGNSWFYSSTNDCFANGLYLKSSKPSACSSSSEPTKAEKCASACGSQYSCWDGELSKCYCCASSNTPCSVGGGSQSCNIVAIT